MVLGWPVASRPPLTEAVGLETYQQQALDVGRQNGSGCSAWSQGEDDGDEFVSPPRREKTNLSGKKS